MNDAKEELTIEKFGTIFDKFLTDSPVAMLIEMPEGELEAKLTDNLKLGPVGQFYILLHALKAVFRELLASIHELVGTDEFDKEDFIDGLLELIKADLLQE